MTDRADIEDDAGNVIGAIDLTTMRVVAPNHRVDAAIEAGDPIYMRKNGIRTILSVDRPSRGRRN